MFFSLLVPFCVVVDYILGRGCNRVWKREGDVLAGLSLNDVVHAVSPMRYRTETDFAFPSFLPCVPQAVIEDAVMCVAVLSTCAYRRASDVRQFVCKHLPNPFASQFILARIHIHLYLPP